MFKNNKKYKITKFDLDEIPDGSVCVFIGKRKSGKSFAIKDLMWHKRDIPIGQIISGSEHANPFFGHFFPSSYIEEDFDVNLLSNIINRQKKIKEYAKNNSREVDTRFLVVFDDCLHDNKWKNTKEIKNIFMNGRHFDITFLLAMQYVCGIPPNLRMNIDYIFLFRDCSNQNRKKLFDFFGASVPSFKVFCSLIDSLGKYECLVICTSADKTKFEDQCMYFKAKIRGNFEWGSDKFREYDKKLKEIKRNYIRSSYNSNSNSKDNVNIIKM